MVFIRWCYIAERLRKLWLLTTNSLQVKTQKRLFSPSWSLINRQNSERYGLYWLKRHTLSSTGAFTTLRVAKLAQLWRSLLMAPDLYIPWTAKKWRRCLTRASCGTSSSGISKKTTWLAVALLMVRTLILQQQESFKAMPTQFLILQQLTATSSFSWGIHGVQVLSGVATGVTHLACGTKNARLRRTKGWRIRLAALRKSEKWTTASSGCLLATGTSTSKPFICVVSSTRIGLRFSLSQSGANKVPRLVAA